MGAGLGHITRAKKVFNVLKLPASTCLFSNSQYLRQTQIKSLFDLSHVTPAKTCHNVAELTQWLVRACQQRKIEKLYLDCFPVGIKGELNGLSYYLPGTEFYCIARHTKWSDYKILIEQPNQFTISYIIEPLDPQQDEFMRQHSKKIESLSLEKLAWREKKSPYKDCCLVVHAGSPTEILLLIKYAKTRLKLKDIAPKIVLNSPEKPQGLDSDVIHSAEFPSGTLMLDAKIIVSGAGFNTLNDLQSETVEHWVYPFERKYDDQYLRATRYRFAREKLVF